jgi:glycine betaine catabolism B
VKLTVKQTKKHDNNTLSILFKKPAGFQFYPAQFIDVAVDIPNPDKGRIYSLSSSPTEDFLMITLRYGITEHKKRLQTLKVGESVEISHPNGTYTLDENSPAVMLAGGVGIASHRSMIKFAVDSKLKIPITLIYSNPDENFIFKRELDFWQKQYPKLTIHYLNTTKSGRLTKDKLITFYPKYQILDTIYYLAGPPSFVEDMEKILTQLKVDRVNIRLDSFDGY